MLVVPEQIADEVDWADGDAMLLTRIPGGVRVMRDAPEMRRQLTLAEQIMNADEELLRKLANS